MIRLSHRLEARWASEVRNGLPDVVLAPRLHVLAESAFVRRDGALLLSPLVGQSLENVRLDVTGLEALVNKFHVEDYVDGTTGLERLFLQGAKAALRLAQRLSSIGRYRVLLSVDGGSDAVTVRFFGLRPGTQWGEDDPNRYPLEDVMIVDSDGWEQ